MVKESRVKDCLVRDCLEHLGVDKRAESGHSMIMSKTGIEGQEPCAPHLWKSLLPLSVVWLSLLQSPLFSSSHEFVMLLWQVLKQTEIPGDCTIQHT